MKTFLALFVGLIATGASSVAQTYSVEWYSIDGGGGTSSGGTYTLSGTVGQPDAGTLSGGEYTLQGGFWPGLVVQGDGGSPTLFIEFSAGNIVLSWSPATPGFSLQQTDNLGAPSWSDGPAGNPTAPIAPTGSARFYRLTRP